MTGCRIRTRARLLEHSLMENAREAGRILAGECVTKYETAWTWTLRYTCCNANWSRGRVENTRSPGAGAENERTFNEHVCR